MDGEHFFTPARRVQVGLALVAVFSLSGCLGGVYAYNPFADAGYGAEPVYYQQAEHSGGIHRDGRGREGRREHRERHERHEQHERHRDGAHARAGKHQDAGRGYRRHTVASGHSRQKAKMQVQQSRYSSSSAKRSAGRSTAARGRR
ncbi:MAG: hypothetical protein LBQ51_10180 [Desulfovibrio sp.]|nr:hypothetical protein [Desulfovibrio sp.]